MKKIIVDNKVYNLTPHGIKKSVKRLVSNGSDKQDMLRRINLKLLLPLYLRVISFPVFIGFYIYYMYIDTELFIKYNRNLSTTLIIIYSILLLFVFSKRDYKSFLKELEKDYNFEYSIIEDNF